MAAPGIDQVIDVSGGTVAEPEIVADDQVANAQRADQQPLDEHIDTDRRHPRIESRAEERVDARLVQQCEALADVDAVEATDGHRGTARADETPHRLRVASKKHDQAAGPRSRK